MKNYTRSLLTVVLAVSIVFSMLCVGAVAETAEPITLTFATTKNTNIADYDTNKNTLWLEESLGINIEWVFLTDASEKFAIMVNAGDDLPDIVNISLSDADIMAYADQGVFIPIEDYIENIPDNTIKTYLESGTDIFNESDLKLITMPDGHIYGLPTKDLTSTNVWGYNAYINYAWLETLGLEVPTTTDELYTVLKAFKEEDPNGNGIADEIPMVGCADNFWNMPNGYLINPFIYYSTYKGLLSEDGQLSYMYNQEGYREALAYMAKLVDEGLLSPLSFSQDVTQYRSLVDGGDYPVVGMVTTKELSLFTNPERYRDFGCIGPLTGPNGDCWATHIVSMDTPSSTFFITRDCKNPELAFMLGDLMISPEGCMWCSYGEAGVDYQLFEKDDPSNVPFIPTAQYYCLRNYGWNTPGQNSYLAGHNPFILGDFLYTEVWDGIMDVNSAFYTRALLTENTEPYRDKAPEELVKKIIYTVDEQEQIADLDANLSSYVMEMQSAFVTGVRSLDEWDAYLSELETIGLSEYLSITQTAYDRMNDK